jgi:hypothetical protein
VPPAPTTAIESPAWASEVGFAQRAQAEVFDVSTLTAGKSKAAPSVVHLDAGLDDMRSGAAPSLARCHALGDFGPELLHPPI